MLFRSHKGGNSIVIIITMEAEFGLDETVIESYCDAGLVLTREKASMFGRYLKAGLKREDVSKSDIVFSMSEQFLAIEFANGDIVNLKIGKIKYSLVFSGRLPHTTEFSDDRWMTVLKNGEFYFRHNIKSTYKIEEQRLYKIIANRDIICLTDEKESKFENRTLIFRLSTGSLMIDDFSDMNISQAKASWHDHIFMIDTFTAIDNKSPLLSFSMASGIATTHADDEHQFTSLVSYGKHLYMSNMHMTAVFDMSRLEYMAYIVSDMICKPSALEKSLTKSHMLDDKLLVYRMASSSQGMIIKFDLIERDLSRLVYSTTIDANRQIDGIDYRANMFFAGISLIRYQACDFVIAVERTAIGSLNHSRYEIVTSWHNKLIFCNVDMPALDRQSQIFNVCQISRSRVDIIVLADGMRNKQSFNVIRYCVDN